VTYKVKLTKIAENEKTREGWALKLPDVGHSFTIFKGTNDNDVQRFSTSRVVTVERQAQDDNVVMFNTLNSRYAVEILDQE
jgi:hypothetical protein